MATKEGYYNIIRYLIARGADINIKDGKGVCKYVYETMLLHKGRSTLLNLNAS